MKKINYLLIVFALGISMANAKPVTPTSAKAVAENFYKLNSKIEFKSSSLVHTELAASGLPLYYAYNINENDGFVIISAEDAVKPIVGYSTEHAFVKPEANSNINFWMKEFSAGVNFVREQNGVADAKTTQEWAKYSNTNAERQANGAASTMNSGNAVLPLMKTLWSQNPYYNALCPGTTGNLSVTGCVATTMAQIMKYWAYPATGTGSSSYTCTTAKGFSNNYGVLSANYGTTTYNWANMPLMVNSANNDVAQLMYECGVSVNMDYAPSGSGAQVLGTNGPSAQHSYLTYFKYDPTQLHGLTRSNINNDTRWLDTIEHDLNIGRVVQYAGFDPNEGGHTWVCDGYDANDNLHMNWGWAGSDNGYFALNNFQTTNGTFNPSTGHQVLVGIVPKSTNTIDASVLAVTSPTGVYCTNSFTPVITLKNYGSTALTSCVINYQIDNGIVQTLNWSGYLAAQQFSNVNLPTFTSTTGSHTLACYTSAPNNAADQNTANDQSTTVYNVNSSHASLPIVESFESASSTWTMSHTSTGVDWTVTTNASATGVNSVMIDNMNNTAGNNSMLQTFSSYDLSTFASPTLTFKAAYQQKATANNDKLQVYTSTDCGASWQSRKALTSTALSALSGGVGSAAYMPTSSQFTTYSVNINAVAASNNVMFRWEFFAGTSLGNNVYLDDINIIDAVATGIKNIETAVGLNIYPNPSTGIMNVSFNLTEKQTVAVNVLDMLGRTVETIPATQCASGETVLTIGNKSTYQAGVYFVNININGQQVSKKIIIE
jgi:hypothetical protein